MLNERRQEAIDQFCFIKELHSDDNEIVKACNNAIHILNPDLKEKQYWIPTDKYKQFSCPICHKRSLMTKYCGECGTRLYRKRTRKKNPDNLVVKKNNDNNIFEDIEIVPVKIVE